jgi:hypothetical protein
MYLCHSKIADLPQQHDAIVDNTVRIDIQQHFAGLRHEGDSKDT